MGMGQVFPKKPDDFAEFTRANDAHVCRVLLRNGVRSADVDDMAQEVFLVGLEQRHEKPKTPGRARAWLAGIAFRVAMNSSRRAKSRRRVFVDASDVDAMGAMGAMGDGIEASAIVSQWLAGLSPLQHDVATLHLQGCTFDAISRELGLPRSSAFNAWQCARKRLVREDER